MTLDYSQQFADDYVHAQKQLSYVTGTQDQFEHWYDWTIPDYHKGNSQQVRDLFNKKFNECILYHAHLWRDRPHNERNKEYYAERYSRLYEDLFRLYEKFPDLPELKTPSISNNEYWKTIALYKHYIKGTCLGYLYE